MEIETAYDERGEEHYGTEHIADMKSFSHGA
jgi:hypothetical protein